MSDSSTYEYRGGCGCGHLKLSLSLTKPITEYEARVCGCSFCSRYGPRYVADPKGSVTLSSLDWDQVTRYQFGSCTAEFLICPTCQAFVAAISEIDSNLFAVTNINALNESPNVSTRQVDFDAETVEDRLGRRSITWTPARVVP